MEPQIRQPGLKEQIARMWEYLFERLLLEEKNCGR